MTTATADAELSKLTALVRQVNVDLPPGCPITASTRFVEDIGMGSINRLMLITLVEQEFGVSLEQHMHRLVELHTVGDTARFLATLKGAA
ncbi:MAG TPA: acyl carrier protein [Rudaea sp.]|nr:acyl carrier protein [Rudaea sp.]